jgi:Ca-activated chloride channel homolog
MFELETPRALIALAMPFLTWLCLPRASETSSSALNIPFFDQIASLPTKQKQRPHTSFFWITLVWSLLTFAASGPTWVGEPLPLEHEGHNIMLILDISGSMDIRDRVQHGKPSTRLNVVKSAAKNFIKNRPGDKLGLVLFGTRAYLQTPLTRDHATVLMRLDDATVGLAGKTTSIGDALGLAIKHMQHVPKPGRVIILLTDGANNSGALLPLKAAQFAQSDNIKVYTIGLGSGSNQPHFGIMPTLSDDLDEQTLKTIASMTDGQYFHATDERSLKHIYQLINQLETVPQEAETLRPKHDYYPYPLTLALFILTLWFTSNTFRRRRT